MEAVSDTATEAEFQVVVAVLFVFDATDGADDFEVVTPRLGAHQVEVPDRHRVNTPAIVIAVVVDHARSDGQVLALSATSLPAGGVAGAGYVFSSTANFGVFFGSGVPTLSAAKGSLYLRSDGTTTNDRMYVNTNGITTWTAVITAA